MSAVAVGDRVQQYRPAAFGKDLLFSKDGIGHSQRIEAVHSFGVHLFRVDAGTEACKDAEAHRLALRLAAHTVEVVHKVEYHRHAPAIRRLPEGFVLVHCCQANPFPDRPARGGTIADVGNDNAGLLVNFFIERSPDGNITGAADDRIVWIDAERREKGVHGAAHTLIEAGFAPKDFGQGAVD